MSEPKLNEVVWIALSEKGWPVPFIGYSYRRKSVVQAYEQRFGHMLKRAGYRMVKVRLTRVKS